MAIREELDLNSAPFQNALQRADHSVTNFAAKFHASIAKFPAAFAALAGIGAVVGATIVGLKKSLDLGGELEDLKAQTGQSAGDLLVLRQAFQNAGLGADGVAANVSKMQKALSGANEEGNSTADALKELGLNMEQVAGGSTVDQMKALTGAFAKVSDPIQRARLATDLFGKSGAQMLRIFGDAGALSTARQQVGGLADTMNQYSAQMDAVGDVLGSLGTKQQQFFGALLSGALPELTKAVDKINSIDLTHLGETLGKAAGAILSATAGLITALNAINNAYDKFLDTILGKKAPDLSEAFSRKELDENAAKKATGGAATLNPFEQAQSAFVTTSLGSVGGSAFGGGGGGDPLLDSGRRQEEYLKTIAAAVGGKPQQVAPPKTPPHP